MPAKKPRAPAHLTPETATWWRSVVTDYELEPHHVRLLTATCEAWDRLQQARETIDRDGLTVRTGDGGLKILSDACSRSMGSMGRSKSVVDIDIAQASE